MHPEAPCSKVLALLHIHSKLCTMLQNAKCYKRIHTPLLSFLTQQKNENLYYCEPFQITASELQFWTSDRVQLDQLQLEIEEGLYPPRFKIAAGGDVTGSALAKISFKGTTENLNTVFLLKPQTLGIVLLF